MTVSDTAAQRFPAIEDPDFYTDNPWPTFAWMREEQPLYHYEPLDIFVLTRHKDIRGVSIKPHVFVNSPGIVLVDLKYRGKAGAATITDSLFPSDGEQVSTADPPRYQELRRVIAPAFFISALDKIRQPVSTHLHHTLDAILPTEIIDWAAIAGALPIIAACHLIELPSTDHRRVQYWSDELDKLGRDLSIEQIEQVASEFASLRQYIVDNVERLKESPIEGSILLSVLLAAELDSDKLTMSNVIMFAMTALVAEGEIVLNALLDRYSRIEFRGPAVPMRPMIRNSWKSMPVTFVEG